MKTLIFGYGITGKAVETFFKVKSKEYLIYDDNENVILDIKKELLFDESQIDLIDEIVISPGINPSHKQIKNFETKNIITDIDLFSREFQGKFIGVTGTNGKTTFVNLLTDFLISKGINAVACGNVGVSPLSINFEDKDFAIVELSSFQLYYASDLKADFGIFLNFHSDHLDWHKDEKEYKKSKLKLLTFLNSDENLVTGFNTFSEKALENILNIPIDKSKDEILMKKYDFDDLSFPIDTCLAFLKIIEKLDINLDEMISKMRSFPGLKVINSDTEFNPTPLEDAEGKDEVFVGSIRKDLWKENRVNLWVISDNLRKGAALNSMQILKRLIEKQN